MPERHRSWHWPFALAGLFVATFGVAVFLQLRDGGHEAWSSAAVDDARMTARHAGQRDSGPLQAPGAAKPAGDTPVDAMGHPVQGFPDDGVDRRSLTPGKGPDYLPEPNEGKD